MQITCENCFTVYELPPEKSGLAGCPYCEHINKPKKKAPSVQFGGAPAERWESTPARRC
ncbi:MAG: hypothetical protein MPW14_22515 [Candidatus Manganitrophus sp.]|nr:MAG: hypothetical protein MPW14_22515 [Candidatus Manganitrophus sp.]